MNDHKNESELNSIHLENGFIFKNNQLHHQKIVQTFPLLKVHFFPICSEDIGSIALMAHMAKMLPIDGQYSEIFIDLPNKAQHLYSKILSNTQHNIIIASQEILKKGEYQSNIPTDAYLQMQQAPLCYLSAHDSRRTLLNQLLSKTHLCEKNIHGLNSITSTLQWTQIRDSYYDFAPTETYSYENTPSFLHAMFLSCQTLIDQDMPWHSDLVGAATGLLSQVISAIKSKKNTIIIADIFLLNALGIQINEVDLSETQTPDNLRSIQKNFDPFKNATLSVAKIPDFNAAELNATPAFLSNELGDILSQTDVGLTWLKLKNHRDFFQQSFLNAFNRARLHYFEWGKRELSHSEIAQFFKFSYKLAAESQKLSPTSFDILLAAHAIIDSNFSMEFIKECRTYHTKSQNLMPEFIIPLNQLWAQVSHMELRRFETLTRMRPRKAFLKKVENKSKSSDLKEITENKYADNSWLQSESPYSCSFPEEDVFFEDLAFRCRDNAQSTIKQKETRSVPLTSHLGDGLDIRETIRNWHTKKTYIKEEMRSNKTDIGAIIFVFNEPAEDEKFSWHSFWSAEKHDRSHLMFYATPFKDKVVGPGIARSDFGGCAVLPIPCYLSDPWYEPFILHYAQSKSEMLLLAASVASEHHTILYIASTPPRRELSDLIKRSGKFILYSNLNEMTPNVLSKMRTFHILAEAGVRSYAHKYIQKDFD